MTKPTNQSQPDDDRGLACPECRCRHFFVVYVRRAKHQRVMRRRECRNCGRRITTYEKVSG